MLINVNKEQNRRVEELLDEGIAKLINDKNRINYNIPLGNKKTYNYNSNYFNYKKYLNGIKINNDSNNNISNYGYLSKNDIKFNNVIYPTEFKKENNINYKKKKADLINDTIDALNAGPHISPVSNIQNVINLNSFSNNQKIPKNKIKNIKSKKGFDSKQKLIKKPVKNKSLDLYEKNKNNTYNYPLKNNIRNNIMEKINNRYNKLLDYKKQMQIINATYNDTLVQNNSNENLNNNHNNTYGNKNENIYRINNNNKSNLVNLTKNNSFNKNKGKMYSNSSNNLFKKTKIKKLKKENEYKVKCEIIKELNKKMLKRIEKVQKENENIKHIINDSKFGTENISEIKSDLLKNQINYDKINNKYKISEDIRIKQVDLIEKLTKEMKNVEKLLNNEKGFN